MSLDRFREGLLEARGIAIDSVLFALESNPSVISANYISETQTFLVVLADASYSFKLVFPGEIMPGGAGHA